MLGVCAVGQGVACADSLYTKGSSDEDAEGVGQLRTTGSMSFGQHSLSSVQPSARGRVANAKAHG